MQYASPTPLSPHKIAIKEVVQPENGQIKAELSLLGNLLIEVHQLSKETIPEKAENRFLGPIINFNIYFCDKNTTISFQTISNIPL